MSGTGNSPKKCADVSRLIKELDKRSNDARLNALEASEELELPLRRLIVRSCVSDSYSLVRCRAAEMLGLIGTASDSARLIRLLQDDDWCVRSSAADSLRCIRSRGAMRALPSALDTERDEVVRRDVYLALGAYPEPEVVERLRSFVPIERLPLARIGLLVALYEHGEPSVLPALLDIFETESLLERRNVIHALDQVELRSEDVEYLRVGLQWVLAIAEFPEGVRGELQRRMDEWGNGLDEE